MSGAKPRTRKEGKRRDDVTWLYLGIAGQIGYTIAIPLVIGVLVGVWVDRVNGTRPVGTLIGLGIGAVISVVGFAKTLRELMTKKRS